MTTKPLPSPELLRKLLDYNPDTGVLIWRTRPLTMFKSQRATNAWNGHFANKEAFTCITKTGYRSGQLLCRPYLAHRVIWAMQAGGWPPSEIDHIDNDRLNNRIGNLRLADRSENCCNRTSAVNATSKYIGVSLHRASGKWQASLRKYNHQNYLGLFFTEVEAAKAYDAAAVKSHGEFANLNFPRILDECPT